ncbi:general substrate transporter [Mycena rosella]|uniref:General substrate transporter n=1 Tax=Mycena rosella TaxID=1033263 RepID=A0AAD7CZQ3_MYCRO|nr:general substrate transporter [Mycena rosella]
MNPWHGFDRPRQMTTPHRALANWYSDAGLASHDPQPTLALIMQIVKYIWLAASDTQIEHAKFKNGPRRTPAEQKAALQAALAIDPGVERWSARAFQLYLVTLVVCFCAGDSGFDGTVMGGVNAMHQYQTYFGLSGSGSKTGYACRAISARRAALTAFHPESFRDLHSRLVLWDYPRLCVPGSAYQRPYLPDRFGRRFAMFTGNGLLIIGAIITAMADSKSKFLGGRFLTGFGSGIGGAAAKSYLAEITPPQTRGMYLGFLNSFYYVGQMVATGMMVSTQSFASNWSWRLPLFVQVVPAALNFLFIFFCPESPRWLYTRGKTDEARRILARFHSSNGDPDSPLVALEIEEIEEKIALDGADKKWWDFRPLFRTRGDRNRTYMVILIGFFGQLSGNGLITYFLPILLKNAGITSQSRQLTLNFVNSITSYAGALFGSFMVDRIGRRKNLLISTGALVVMLAIISGLLSSYGSAARANAGITFIYLFMVIFSFGWTAMQALYPAEVLSYEVRAKGLAFLGICSQSASLITTFGMPSAIEALQWKIYLVYMCWDAFEWVVIYFFVVETKGLTLEEITEVFEQPNPRKYSTQKLREDL